MHVTFLARRRSVDKPSCQCDDGVVETPPTHQLLDRVVEAVRRTPDGPAVRADEGETLQALAALHELRAHLLAWEPQLIEAAREQGVSWARLAPVLGVTSRQAAERRYLRLRPGVDAELTGEQRVQSTRDRRAGDRAVAAWARDHAAELRQIAGQVSGVPGLSSGGRRRARTLVSSMSGDDPATLLEPLAEMHRDLVDEHTKLAERVDQVSRRVRRVRRETQRRRGSAAQS
jgi:hypothetical protein